MIVNDIDVDCKEIRLEEIGFVTNRRFVLDAAHVQREEEQNVGEFVVGGEK